MKRIIKLGVLLVVALMLMACEKESDSLEAILESKNYIVLDVRTKEEYDEGHVVGSVNVPYDTIDESFDLSTNIPVLVYCKSGKRSAIAYETLKKLGYQVYDLGAYDTVNLDKE